jgi:hypothetical protein
MTMQAAKFFMKTLKYEEVYRQEYRDLAEARASVEQFIEKISLLSKTM